MLKKIFTLVLFLVLISNPLKAGIIERNNSLLDTTKPVIIHSPFGAIQQPFWPINVSATVSDSSGIDSVWVRWYKNTTSNPVRRFKLLNTTGNNYSGLFNSMNSEVTAGDVIYYRIIAQDNSPNHNRDSTTLYCFPIIGMVYCISGTGTDSSYYPFSTSWQDCRTQFLILNNEINPCASGSFLIPRIGFNFSSYSNQVINNFTVRLQNTNLTDLNGFVNSGWTTVYSGPYIVPGNGIQFIDFVMPYFLYWYSYNLLVEICYNNTTGSTNSMVKSSFIPGKTWSNATDNDIGCSLIGGTTRNNRPNFYFYHLSIEAISNNEKISSDYKLSQNYPNPFNPFTRIDFNIPKKGFVNLKVFDILGREVQTLLNEEKSAGSYSFDFNAADLSSGVYFYKLEADGFTDVKRMVIIK